MDWEKVLDHGEGIGDHWVDEISHSQGQVIMALRLVGLGKSGSDGSWACVGQECKRKRVRFYTWKRVTEKPFCTMW